MALGAHKLRFELRELLLVALGAMPGALLRWQAGVQLGPWLGGSAGADLLVNVVGSFVLGFLAGPIPRRTGLVAQPRTLPQRQAGRPMVRGMAS